MIFVILQYSVNREGEHNENICPTGQQFFDYNKPNQPTLEYGEIDPKRLVHAWVLILMPHISLAYDLILRVLVSSTRFD